MRKDDEWVRLSHKAESEGLTQDEIASILVRLGEDINPYDKYALIVALGNLHDLTFVPDIEPFLSEKRAPQVAALALRVLCVDLKLSERYVDRITGFVDGVPWDEEEDARLVAIQVSGEHLRLHQSADLLERLIDVEQNPDERPLVRETARDALARAIGLEWKEVHRANPSEIMKRARERLG